MNIPREINLDLPINGNLDIMTVLMPLFKIVAILFILLLCYVLALKLYFGILRTYIKYHNESF